MNHKGLSRRDFVRLTIGSGLSLAALPHLAHASSWDYVKSSVRVAFFTSRLHPGRFVAGVIFDGIYEVLVKPLTISAYNTFVDSMGNSRPELTSYQQLPRGEILNPFHYKAAIVVYGVADYEEYKKNQIKIKLTRDIDLNRFAQIRDYLNDEKIRFRTKSSHLVSTVGHDLEPDELFDTEYFIYGKNEETHISNILSLTKNNVFKKLAI